MLMAKSANSKINSRSSLAIREEGLRQSAIAVTVVVIIMIMMMMMMMMIIMIMIMMMMIIMIIIRHHSSSFVIIRHHSSSFVIIRHHSSSFVIIINPKNHIMIFSVLDVSAIRSYTGSLQLAGALPSFTKNSTIASWQSQASSPNKKFTSPTNKALL